MELYGQAETLIIYSPLGHPGLAEPGSESREKQSTARVVPRDRNAT